MADDRETDSPLDPTEAHLQRIRERAYRLWEADGRPDGQDLEFWERARELDAFASHPGAALVDADPIERVDETTLEENLGEFPDRSADQGERRPTPMTRAELDGARSER